MADSRGWDPRKIYDVTEVEKKAMKERAQLRATLRREWQMKATSPFRGVGGFIFDPAVQRFNSMRVTHWDTFKATPKSAAFGFAFGILPMFFIYWRFSKDKNDREKLFRTGTISYRDRNWKFI